MRQRKSVLQIGFGAFGPAHLEAWLRLGFGDRLWVSDSDPEARARAAAYNLPAERIVADFRTVLDRVELVDVLTPTPAHVAVCGAALEAGRDVFCEKPLTLELPAAERLAAIVEKTGRILQVGYFFRHHPLFRHARERVAEGDLGELRYLSGTFAGFKRARADMGVTASDAVHFLDYFNWLTGAPPERVFAIWRDHFGRGLDDLALILLEYPGGVVARVEAGLIQPGRHVDLVTPGALTTKEVALCGAAGAIEIDFPAERLVRHRVRHELQDGLWRPVFDDARIKRLPPATAVDVLASQFTEFLGHAEARSRPAADVQACGVGIARLLEAIERSAISGQRVAVAHSGN
jgi:UDP-N-acetylglucosamine 3-dehydrogenase